MGLIINKEKLNSDLCEKLIQICPFGAIKKEGDGISISMECKLCKLCVKNGEGAVSFEEDQTESIDKSMWNGIAVLCEHFHGKIHDVTFELIGKARELSKVTDHKVLVVMLGNDISDKANELFEYGADEVYVYDDPSLENFLIETYANVLEDFINKVKPSSFLVGATNIGRSLAPRVAARFHCGLTADCTVLEMEENTDLVQIRPAFGGNIMARIISTNARPQFCTVRYKIFAKPEKVSATGKTITKMDVTDDLKKCRAEILDIETKPAVSDISEADVIVQVGRGVKSTKDLEFVKEFADSIGATMACTRPLVECGWFASTKQIGLSGRTVKPKLLICVGVSGAVQTVAGLKGSDCIIAINTDEKAPIFDVAHYGFVGDLYEIIPELMKKLN